MSAAVLHRAADAIARDEWDGGVVKLLYTLTTNTVDYAAAYDALLSRVAVDGYAVIASWERNVSKQDIIDTLREISK